MRHESGLGPDPLDNMTYSQLLESYNLLVLSNDFIYDQSGEAVDFR